MAGADAVGAEERRQAPDREVPRHQVRELTQGGAAAELEHDGAVYVLRITRQNKVILTK